LWYFPPPEGFEALALYANVHGDPKGRPYFSIDGQKTIAKEEWSKMRSKFYCQLGISNVWDEPAVRGDERLKRRHRCIHNNQKPLRLLERILLACTDQGDIVWEPFGGLCSVAVAAQRLGRLCYSAEIDSEFYRLALDRLNNFDAYATETSSTPKELALL